MHYLGQGHMFAWLKELVLDGIGQFKRKQEAKHLRKKEQDERYWKDIRCWSDATGEVQCPESSYTVIQERGVHELGLHLGPNPQPGMSHLKGKLTGSGLSVSQPIAQK